MSPLLVVPLRELDRKMLALGGGKAVNLGEMLQAGLPVPDGVCLTTAAFARVAEAARLGDLLSGADADAAAIRQRLLDAPMPRDVGQAIDEAVAQFGESTPLAVRSSATAEDLPFASFAGQQETYLNISGAEAVREAVRKCWASLWTDRAAAYRTNNGIDQRTVQLAVVIQALVDAEAAGVLFTANPLTGHRGQAVVEASAGLGEAVVSGSVNPDHYLVDADAERVLEGPRDGSLSSAQVLALVRLGRQVEEHFGAPQDIEFAFDRGGAIWLVQSRAITTLYPLPDAAPKDRRNLRIYLSFNVIQGVFRPLTPIGIDAFRLLGISMSSLFGIERTDAVLQHAGGRLFMDVTPMVRWPPTRRALRALLGVGEARSGQLLDSLLNDPRLAPLQANRRRVVSGVLNVLRSTQLPLRVVALVLAPHVARRSIGRLRHALLAEGRLPDNSSPLERLARAERLVIEWPPRIAPVVVPAVFAGVGSFMLAERLLGDLASGDEKDAVRRALPYNPTTEMDLDLWTLACEVRRDEPSRTALETRPAAELARSFRAGSLPGPLQVRLAEFLHWYGHRAIAEIDMGVPRWSDDPTPLLAHLTSYLALDEATQSPQVQFRAAAAQAERTIEELSRRAASGGARRAALVRFLLRRGRALAGFREMPKFLIVLVLAPARALVASVGRDLVTQGQLDDAEDAMFLTFPELRAAVTGAEVRSLVAERRTRYADESRRRHVPRMLLSDGTEPAPALEPLDGDVLRGTPASAGLVTGRARVVLEPDGARLEPGEILVAPSTDPGWTPLFLTAGGLVMEMGGAMSHGAVVAREYGIPAVVGVPGATERIADGATVSVDGSAGSVQLLP